MDPAAGRAVRGRPRKFFAGVRDALIAYARHQRRLAEPDKDGTPYRAHLAKAARRGSAEAIAALAGPELPEGGLQVWQWFQELNAARGAGGFGPAPIGYAELEAWARLTGRRLAPREVHWLRALDAVWCAPVAKEPSA